LRVSGFELKNQNIGSTGPRVPGFEGPSYDQLTA
jgi:hypothetical protein